jgi:hypothetical protein
MFSYQKNELKGIQENNFRCSISVGGPGAKLVQWTAFAAKKYLRVFGN